MFPSRKTIRLPKYDYSKAGYYFITICTKDRIECFGKIENSLVKLDPQGMIAENLWMEIPKRHPVAELDEFIIMPNHVHGIIVIGSKGQDAPRRVPTFGPLVANSLGSIVNHYKGAVKKECNKNGFSEFQWQGRFYDNVIRDDESLNRIREYIKNNPAKWEQDRNNPDNIWI